uniref:IS5 family transposase n=1 Tax=Nocardia brevicatena TaxID=37327 RepID=UPI003F6849FF
MRKGERPPWIVPDDLWEQIEPLLPRPAPRVNRAGRKRLPDRQVLCGILFVLHTGIQWEYLPQQLGFGSGMTCWSRLAEWNEAGVWRRLHEVLLAELHAGDRLDWERAVIYSSHVRAARRGPKRAEPGRPQPVGLETPRPREGRGIPLAASLTGGNRNDVTELLPLIDTVPVVRGHPAADPCGCTPTAATTTTSTVDCCGTGAFTRLSPAADSLTAPDSVASAGPWNAPSPGTTASKDCASAGNDATTFTRHSSAWPPASSSTDTFTDSVRNSYTGTAP